MQIKCPECSTAYNVPDDRIGDKPRKMRCARCKKVFAIVRRAAPQPTGYEEFTGRQQHLPAEFAFLREAPPTTEASPIAAPPPEPPSVDIDVEQAAPPAELEAGPVPAETAAPLEGAPHPSSAPISRRPERRTSDAADLFRTSTSTWESEEPLELNSFATEPPSGQWIGKLVAAIILAVILFFVWVSWRNGWNLSPDKLFTQLEFAFSGAAREVLPDEVEKLEATIEGRRAVERDDKKFSLVVTGAVFNNGNASVNHVILRARLIDGQGDRRAEIRQPCGRTIDDVAIKRSAAGEIQSQYLTGGSISDCAIPSEDSTSFTLVFDDLPADFSETFRVEVTPVAARLGG